jgi:hypothetical protein
MISNIHFVMLMTMLNIHRPMGYLSIFISTPDDRFPLVFFFYFIPAGFWRPYMKVKELLISIGIEQGGSQSSKSYIMDKRCDANAFDVSKCISSGHNWMMVVFASGGEDEFYWKLTGDYIDSGDNIAYGDYIDDSPVSLIQ